LILTLNDNVKIKMEELSKSVEDAIEKYIDVICQKYNIPKEELIDIWRYNENLKQDIGKFRTNTKEQFYTDKMVAKSCINHIVNLIPNINNYLWIEPSAGNGSFLHNVPETFKKIGLDIDPKSNDINREDYLKWNPPFHKNIIVFGNPPFGRQSSLAKSFILKSCKFANVIAFILPRSFTKPSMYNIFDLKFHLIYCNELGKNSFVINGLKYDVPCVFQIWQKRDDNRTIEEKTIPYMFQYVKQSEQHDIVFRRVGGLAGKCYKNNGGEYSIQSHYFIKLDNNIIPFTDTIVEKINSYIFPSNTVGPRSLSKSE
jgi:hypothetical protein